MIVEKSLRAFHVEVKIKDINDDAPRFIQRNICFVLEIRMPGSFLPLEGALDADISPNSHVFYTLSSSECFILNVQRKSEIQSLGLILKNSVDREVKAYTRFVACAHRCREIRTQWHNTIGDFCA